MEPLEQSPGPREVVSRSPGSCPGQLEQPWTVHTPGWRLSRLRTCTGSSQQKKWVLSVTRERAFGGTGSASCMARPAKRSSMSAPLLQGWAKPKQACLAPAPEPGCATVSVQPGSEFSAVISSSKWRGRMRNISLLRADLQAHAEGADCIHGSQGRAASSRCDLESTWERGGTSCTGHVNTLQHVLRLSCTGGPLRPPVETQGLPVRPAGSEGGTRRSHTCLWKASHGEMGTWKSSGASEELTSVLLGKEGEQAIPDLVERACFTFCPCPIVVPSLPHWGPWKPPALCL